MIDDCDGDDEGGNVEVSDPLEILECFGEVENPGLAENGVEFQVDGTAVAPDPARRGLLQWDARARHLSRITTYKMLNIEI